LKFGLAYTKRKRFQYGLIIEDFILKEDLSSYAERKERLRQGISEQFDTPAPAGPRKGEILHPIYERMLNEYYEARGWDQETSIPTSEKLKGLGLDDVDKDFAPFREPDA
jgi:aldehyde:ferredoxin oxidoreductase